MAALVELRCSASRRKCKLVRSFRMVAHAAMPTAPPRLRIMLKIPISQSTKINHRMWICQTADHKEKTRRPLIQAADGDARALSVEFLRCGQPDPAVAAGDKDILSRSPPHFRFSFSHFLLFL